MRIPSPSAQNPSSRVSDMDFSDVFGGPPRRSSFPDAGMYSVDVEDEVAGSAGSPWSGYGGKPVFGDEVKSRRRYPNEDFFDDIFRGEQSVSSSPRMAARDPFSSSPSSRVSSPARALHGRVEPFGSFMQFSLPARLSNTDFPATVSMKSSQYRGGDGLTASNFSSNTSFSNISSQIIQNHHAPKGSAYSTSHQSPLSNEFSVNNVLETKDSNAEGVPAVSHHSEDLKGTEFPNNSNQFHFSIHKWASKGVPLVMSLRRRNNVRSNEKSKLERCLSSAGRVDSDLVSEVHGADVSITDYRSHESGTLTTSRVKYEMQGDELSAYSTSEEEVEPRQVVREPAPVAPHSVTLDTLETTYNEVSTDVTFIILEEESEIRIQSKNLSWEEAAEESKLVVNTEKCSMKPLCSTSFSIGEKKDDGKIFTRDTANQTAVKIKEERHLNVKSDRRRENVDNYGSSQSLKPSGDKKGTTGVTGKVKEFVKIFNQESSFKPTINVGGRSSSSRWRDRATIKLESGTSSISEKHGNFQESDVFSGETCLHGPEMGTGKQMPPKDRQYEMDNTNKISEVSSGLKDSLTSDSEHASGGIRASISSIDIREISTELDQPSEEEKQHDEIKVLESKILQWAKGKEGNIRALLSTLQYVLWPTSGWKPVPLVNIIEGNAVKRAYQKALLCLHPDKLQQKGAASHHKYIAEKVFDVLQEAWDHFNSLGSI